jgi:hypothetical protein
VETGNPVKPHAITEQVLLDKSGVFVSNSRFVYDGQTYAMSNVTSVKTGMQTPSKTGPFISMIIGGVIVLFGFSDFKDYGVVAMIIGLVIFFLGLIVFRSRVPTYFVILNSASGEHKSKPSVVLSDIEEIVAALNQAIVIRG